MAPDPKWQALRRWLRDQRRVYRDRLPLEQPGLFRFGYFAGMASVSSRTLAEMSRLSRRRPAKKGAKKK